MRPICPIRLIPPSTQRPTQPAPFHPSSDGPKDTSLPAVLISPVEIVTIPRGTIVAPMKSLHRRQRREEASRRAGSAWPPRASPARANDVGHPAQDLMRRGDRANERILEMLLCFA